jgi:hypothetical protein
MKKESRKSIERARRIILHKYITFWDNFEIPASKINCYSRAPDPSMRDTLLLKWNGPDNKLVEVDLRPAATEQPPTPPGGSFLGGRQKKRTFFF